MAADDMGWRVSRKHRQRQRRNAQPVHPSLSALGQLDREHFAAGGIDDGDQVFVGIAQPLADLPPAVLEPQLGAGPALRRGGRQRGGEPRSSASVMVALQAVAVALFVGVVAVDPEVFTFRPGATSATSRCSCCSPC